MNTPKPFWFLFGVALLWAGLAASASAQSADAVIEQAARAIHAGRADDLAIILNDQVEVTLPPDADGSFSHDHATQIIKSFFMNYQAQSFAILVKQVNDGTSYAMGKYVSNRGKFDVNIFVRRSGANFVVYQIRFHKTN